jgi:GTPase SAR1 family protein
MNSLKCVVLGPPSCGKTNLIHRYMTDRFLGPAPKSSVQRYDVNYIMKEKDYEQFSNDVPTNALQRNFNFKVYDYDINKSNSDQYLNDNELYQVDVIILCFDLTSKKLLKTKYKTCIDQTWSTSVPVVLVSCQNDLFYKNDDKQPFIQNEKGFFQTDEMRDLQSLCKTFSSSLYFECSAYSGINVEHVFDGAFKLAAANKLNRIKNEIAQKQIPINTHEKFKARIETKYNKDECLLNECKSCLKIKKNVVTCLSLENFKQNSSKCRDQGSMRKMDVESVTGIVLNSTIILILWFFSFLMAGIYFYFDEIKQVYYNSNKLKQSVTDLERRINGFISFLNRTD